MSAPARSARADARSRAVSIEHEIPFHDVDVTNRVWHGHYYKYFELARTALFKQHGLEDPELVPKQFLLYVIETRCRYSSPLQYGDRIRVSAWFRETRRRLAIGYEIENLSHGRRAARGLTTLAICGRDGEMLALTPPEIAERVRSDDAG